jgi:uncharacterized protein YndB with AHSA1/START domain
MASDANSASRDFVIARVFDAPRDLVWKCFTEPERLKQWWGPKGFTVVAAHLDLRVGGIYHYGMKTPDGATMWGKFVYREIAPPQRLVFVNSFSDENGGITRHPGSATWPLQLLSTFTFEALPGGKTKFTVTWRTLDATAEEQNTFDTMHDSMQQGWSGTMDQLDAYMARA